MASCSFAVSNYTCNGVGVVGVLFGQVSKFPNSGQNHWWDREIAHHDILRKEANKLTSLSVDIRGKSDSRSFMTSSPIPFI